MKWDWLGDPRLVLGMRSYKKNRQRTVIPMIFIRPNGRRVAVDVKKEDAVTVLFLPGLVPPRALSGAAAMIGERPVELMPPPSGSFDAIAYKGTVYPLADGIPQKIRRAILHLGAPHGARDADLHVKLNIGDVARFLSKVAYGMHVAVRGVPNLEESPALAIMRGERDDVSNWVGCEPIEQATDDRLHVAWLEDREIPGLGSCAVVRLALFNSSRTPFTYSVITHAPGWRGVAPLATSGKIALAPPIHMVSMH